MSGKIVRSISWFLAIGEQYGDPNDQPKTDWAVVGLSVAIAVEAESAGFSSVQAHAIGAAAKHAANL